MSGDAIKLDSQSFNLFQKELHRRRGEYRPVRDEKMGVFKDTLFMLEGVNTIFQHRFKKISWYTPIKEQLNVVDNGSECIYTANNSYDQLMKTFKDLMLPALRIKSKYADKYRMCWTHNIGINIDRESKLMANDIPINTFDSVGHDILSQFGYLVKPGFKKHHLISIGSVPKLEQWTTFLPAHQLNVLQPFYYTKANHLALPLLASTITQFRHIYKPRRKILDLIRMQKFNDKKNAWIDIKPNYAVIDGIKDKDALLKTPELWGRYAKITDEERHWYKECSEGMVHEYFYDDLVVCDDQNKKVYGDVVEIPLKAPTPVKAIFWVNENLAATRYNNYSNYTSNAENVYQGWNPCKNFNIRYATSMRVEDMSIDHAEREEAWEFPRAPWEPGYNVVTFCNNPFSIDGEASVDLQGNNAQLAVKLGNTDPSLISPENYEPKPDGDPNQDSEDEEDEHVTEPDTKTKNGKITGPEFIVRARLLVYRKLSYHFDNSKGGYIFKVDHLDLSNIWYDDENQKSLNSKK